MVGAKYGISRNHLVTDGNQLFKGATWHRGAEIREMVNGNQGVSYLLVM